MVRKAGFEAAGRCDFDPGPRIEKVRCLLVKCITAGVLAKSVTPDWGTGSAFQLLEWLGDGMLRMYLTQQVLSLFAASGGGEGALSIVRSSCEGTGCLARVFNSLHLSRLVRHDHCQKVPNYILEDKKCADIVEAVLGELYEANKREEACKSLGGHSTNDRGSLVREALLSLLELIFCIGVAECPNRMVPTPSEVMFIYVSPLKDPWPAVEAAAAAIAAVESVAAEAKDARRQQHNVAARGVVAGTAVLSPNNPLHSRCQDDCNADQTGLAQCHHRAQQQQQLHAQQHVSQREQQTSRQQPGDPVLGTTVPRSDSPSSRCKQELGSAQLEMVPAPQACCAVAPDPGDAIGAQSCGGAQVTGRQQLQPDANSNSGHDLHAGHGEDAPFTTPPRRAAESVVEPSSYVSVSGGGSS